MLYFGGKSRHLLDGRRTVPTFASMSNTRIVIALLLLLSGNHVKAQFNTVSCPGNRYKVTVENPTRTTALAYQDKFALRLSERPIHREEEVSQRH